MNVSEFPILLVGDDAGQTSFVQQAFARANLVNPLRSVPGTTEATAYLAGVGAYQDRREHPAPSLLLVDVDRPGGSWRALIKWIRHRPSLRGLSVALMGTSPGARDRDRAEKLGVTTFLRKPLDTEGLLRMMISTGMYWVILRRRQDPGATPAPGSAEAPGTAAKEDPTVRRPAARQDTEILGDQIRFQKTSWDLVKSAEHSRGMDVLIRAYWKPLYFFVRQKGFDNETAKDVVQDFLADALERGTIARADPARGKFRTFLLTALCNFIRDWHKSSNRLKRGGGHVTLSLDFDVGERQYSVEIASGETPETILNRAWLQSVLEESIAQLSGNPVHLQAFRLMIQGATYSDIAGETGLSESAVKAAVFRLRQQLRDLLLRRVQGSGDLSDLADGQVEELAALFR
jgi:RNA polymerase sigma-70 factor (ECF subfamily)